jgi:O-antigen ligase
MLTKERVAGITKGLLFFNAVIAESVLRHREFAEKSIDFQIIVKMGMWAITFAFCAYCFRLWVGKLTRIDKFMEVLFLTIVVVACFYAPNILYSLASAFSLFSVFFLLFLSSALLKNKEILWPIILGSTLVSAVSIVVYFVNPEFGRMAQVDGSPGNRLTGITGSANVAGYISAFTCLALYNYRRYIPNRIPLYFYAMIAINFAVLLLSNSRTSLAALLLSIAVAEMVRLTLSRIIVFFSLICFLILFLMVVDIESILVMASRSGDIREITSGTGRSDIWSLVMRLIEERPFFGWGYASTIFILPDEGAFLGYALAHAHNAVLQALVSVGIVGFVPFAALFLMKIYYAMKFRDPLNTSFMMFLVVESITECIAFQGPATLTSLVLATVLSLKFNEKNETSYYPHQQRLSGPDAEPENEGYPQSR